MCSKCSFSSKAGTCDIMLMAGGEGHALTNHWHVHPRYGCVAKICTRQNMKGVELRTPTSAEKQQQRPRFIIHIMLSSVKHKWWNGPIWRVRLAFSSIVIVWPLNVLSPVPFGSFHYTLEVVKHHPRNILPQEFMEGILVIAVIEACGMLWGHALRRWATVLTTKAREFLPHHLPYFNQGPT